VPGEAGTWSPTTAAANESTLVASAAGSDPGRQKYKTAYSSLQDFIRNPYRTIDWTTPEGGFGPKYQDFCCSCLR
jgi:hypothetical protein